MSGTKYYYNEKLFTGKVQSTFNDGSTSGFTTFKDGIPSGKWESYGYDGEIIQEGWFKPVKSEDLAGLDKTGLIELMSALQKKENIISI